MRLTEVFTLKEASEKYGYNLDTLRRFMNRGASGLIENEDYKKSGGTWIITIKGIKKYQKVKKK